MLNIVIGASLAIAGYISKYLVDYYFLKAPRLKPEIIIRPYITEPPLNNYRKYTYNIEITIHNFSENAAYDFALLGFTVNPVFVKQPGKTILSKSPITSNTPLLIKIAYTAHLPVTPEFTYADAQGRLPTLNKEFKISYSFKNALGKSYNRHIAGRMTMSSEIGEIVSENK